MPFEDYQHSRDCHSFIDVTIRAAACEAVEDYLNHHAKKARKAQLYSIPAIIQAEGMAGLKQLAQKQESKNTSQENKEFWKFVQGLLEREDLSFSLFHLVQEQVNHNPLLQAGPDQSERAQRKTRSAYREELTKLTLPIYFEHFTCHYFYRTTS